MAGLKVKIGADASQFERTMRGVRKDVGGVKKAILGIGAATGAILAVNKAFDGMRAAARGAFEFIKGSSEEAASIETLTVAFENMLGSVEAADERMARITSFAAATPFEIGELAAASKSLQAMGGNLLATGDGLRLVGNMAAFADRPLGEIATTFGRTFDQMRQGINIELAQINRLQELGLLTDGARQRFVKYNEAVRKGNGETRTAAEVLEILGGEIRDVDGLMARLAETTDGKKSMVKDAMSQIKVAFGTGFNDGLKDALDAATEFIPQFQERMSAVGQIIGSAISESVRGNHEIFVEAGALIGELVRDGFKAGLQGLGESAASGILRALSHASVGIGGDKLKQFMQDQADVIDQGSRIGLRQNVRSISANAQERMQNLQQLSNQSRNERGLVGVGGTGVMAGTGDRELRAEELALVKEINRQLKEMNGQFSTP